ncbi:MAG: cobalamin-binding protein [Rhodospirillaceae bacterium]|jgi:5-methyltetrahydrofolate--homocysteine methyltransferase|nr:cobalamin-binding protein [Rhodospirillaceae bacterium]MBT5299223.1 cobalamin-binding protein [Rhodospirillaceae bacterium]MBT5513204.1 cobalamin-binding protein [Rhodospirillaceae bacterium]MBT6886397.1 cobalamin-binding protein [Rhodospirillaceae bacterium]MBT7510828.1 cobalamin-binding protein [Rhodospirillaceae bacterium]
MPLEIETEIEFDLEDLKHDIETSRATDRWNDAPDALKELFHVLEWNIIEGEHMDTAEFIEKALKDKVTARTLIAGPMATGIAEVGRRFKMDEYFLPEVMMSAKCMHAALELLKPLIIAEKTEDVGTVVVGTVQGDLHDIGKKIVAMMMEAAGFTVVDLGVTVSPDEFIAAIREHNPVIVGFSALLTTTMNMQWETIKLITAEGLREDVKVFVGGAPISQNWCDKIGADAYGMDALVSVDKAKACITNLKNMKGGDPELHAAMLKIDEERDEAKLADAATG